jgi:hypothetical protein
LGGLTTGAVAAVTGHFNILTHAEMVLAGLVRVSAKELESVWSIGEVLESPDAEQNGAKRRVRAVRGNQFREHG